MMTDKPLLTFAGELSKRLQKRRVEIELSDDSDEDMTISGGMRPPSPPPLRPQVGHTTPGPRTSSVPRQQISADSGSPAMSRPHHVQPTSKSASMANRPLPALPVESDEKPCVPKPATRTTPKKPQGSTEQGGQRPSNSSPNSSLSKSKNASTPRAKIPTPTSRTKQIYPSLSDTDSTDNSSIQNHPIHHTCVNNFSPATSTTTTSSSIASVTSPSTTKSSTPPTPTPRTSTAKNATKLSAQRQSYQEQTKATPKIKPPVKAKPTSYTVGQFGTIPSHEPSKHTAPTQTSSPRPTLKSTGRAMSAPTAVSQGQTPVTMSSAQSEVVRIALPGLARQSTGNSPKAGHRPTQPPPAPPTLNHPPVPAVVQTHTESNLSLSIPTAASSPAPAVSPTSPPPAPLSPPPEDDHVFPDEEALYENIRRTTDVADRPLPASPPPEPDPLLDPAPPLPPRAGRKDSTSTKIVQPIQEHQVEWTSTLEERDRASTVELYLDLIDPDQPTPPGGRSQMPLPTSRSSPVTSRGHSKPLTTAPHHPPVSVTTRQQGVLHRQQPIDDADEEDEGVYEGIPNAIHFDSLLNACTLLPGTNPPHYKLPVKEVGRCPELKVRKVQYGSETPYMKQKSVLMVGETGTGKSTMIDALTNHLFGVRLEDNFCLRLIDTMGEDSPQAKSQSISQTDWITCYTLHRIPGGAFPYTLNIVDTPGFGDTRGMDRDKLIADQIQELFSSRKDHGLDFLDAICFVVKSVSSRLTVSMRYILHSVLRIFGRNLEDSIFVMCSYSDGGPPIVIQALIDATMPFSQHFMFNNVWMDGKSACPELFTQTYWQMGFRSFEKFTSILAATESKSLQMSADVLEERYTLENAVEGLLCLVSATTGDLVRVQETQEKLTESKKSFCVMIPVAKRLKQESKDTNMNCGKCSMTCRKQCDKMDSFLAKFNTLGRRLSKCKVCKCVLSEHKFGRWYYVITETLQKKTLQDLQKLYGSTDLEEMVDIMKDEAKQLLIRIQEALQRVRQSVERLEQIALKPQSSGTIDYIDMVLKKEMVDMKPGYERRVDMMRRLRSQNKLLLEVAHASGDGDDSYL